MSQVSKPVTGDPGPLVFHLSPTGPLCCTLCKDPLETFPRVSDMPRTVGTGWASQCPGSTASRRAVRHTGRILSRQEKPQRYQCRPGLGGRAQCHIRGHLQFLGAAGILLRNSGEVSILSVLSGMGTSHSDIVPCDSGVSSDNGSGTPWMGTTAFTGFPFRAKIPVTPRHGGIPSCASGGSPVTAVCQAGGPRRGAGGLAQPRPHAA